MIVNSRNFLFFTFGLYKQSMEFRTAVPDSVNLPLPRDKNGVLLPCLFKAPFTVSGLIMSSKSSLETLG